jgi:hypothetical protein
MHACVLLFLLVVTFLVHAFLPKIPFLFNSFCFQQPPNIDMWLILSHLTPMCFIDLPCDCLELLHELCCLCLGLRGLLLKCVQYLRNLVNDHPCTFCLSLCHMCFGFLCLCNDLCFSLLVGFHLSLALLFLCLRSYEFCLQFLHVLHPFDALCDQNCLLPLFEVLDSCTYPFFFLVPLLDMLIFFQPHPKLCFFLEQVGHCINLSFYLFHQHNCIFLPFLLHYW